MDDYNKYIFQVYLIFSPSGAVSGFSGCNYISGNFTTTLTEISISVNTRTNSKCMDNLSIKF